MNTNGWIWIAVPVLAAPLFLAARTSLGAPGESKDGLTRVSSSAKTEAAEDNDAQSAPQPNAPQHGARAGDSKAQGGSARHAGEFDAVLWRERLQQKDLESRERDFDTLVREAADNESARREIEGWSKDDSNPDLAWTSRLVLREITGHARAGGLQRLGAQGFSRGFGDDHFGDLRSRFEDLQQRFGGIDSMFDDLQREFDRMGAGQLPGVPHGGLVAPGIPGPGQLQQSQSQSYSLQVSPDGVKVEVSEDVNGKQETKTYTAKDLDELYAAHPELRDQFGARVQIFGNHGTSGNRRDDLFGGQGGPGDDPTWNRPARPLQSGLRTDILGVMIQKPSDEDVTARKLDAGVGLKVESIQPDTLAQKIGVMKGDVVVEVNGRVVKSAEDVRDALGARHDEEDVNVTVVDASGQRRTLTWRASAMDDKHDKHDGAPNRAPKGNAEPRHN
jgi:hypothetical protein